MSSIIIVNLKGCIYPSTIADFIANKYHVIVRHEIKCRTINYSDSFSSNIVFDADESDLIDIFYDYSREKDSEALEYFRSIGLEEMVSTDTTYLSTKVGAKKREIMKSIVQEFGGWICFDDQLEEDKYYYFEGRRNTDHPIKTISDKSLYEQYASKVQPYTLVSTVTFQHAINCIRSYKNNKSVQFIDNAIDIISNMFSLSYEEVRDAVDGKEYWISCAGMYDSN